MTRKTRSTGQRAACYAYVGVGVGVGVCVCARVESFSTAGTATEVDSEQNEFGLVAQKVEATRISSNGCRSRDSLSGSRVMGGVEAQVKYVSGCAGEKAGYMEYQS